jgi:succinate dehydrogenase/fumarate reductase flavoprotein subunit
MGLLNSTFVGIVVVLTGFILIRLYSPSTTIMENKKVIVIGGGLAGMSAALEAHKLGAEVILVEKEPKLGGNSAKASSGINAVNTPAQRTAHSMDTPEKFVGDTIKSGG